MWILAKNMLLKHFRTAYCASKQQQQQQSTFKLLKPHKKTRSCIEAHLSFRLKACLHLLTTHTDTHTDTVSVFSLFSIKAGSFHSLINIPSQWIISDMFTRASYEAQTYSGKISWVNFGLRSRKKNHTNAKWNLLKLTSSRCSASSLLLSDCFKSSNFMAMSPVWSYVREVCLTRKSDFNMKVTQVSCWITCFDMTG